MTWLAVPILASFCLYYLMVIRRVGLLTPESLFVYMNLLMAVGSLPLLDPGREADEVHGYVLAYTLTCFMLVSGVVHLSRPKPRTSLAYEVVAFRPSIAYWILFVLSVTVVVIYYFAVGYSALLRGLANTVSGGSEDVAGLRVDSYSGSRYFFPGYVNQFKNVLLPALTVVLVTYWARSGRQRWLSAGLLSVIVLFGLLGTGQRGAFVTFAMTLLAFVYLMEKRAFPRRGAIIVLLVVPVVMLSTVALGRSNNSYSANAGAVARSATVLSELQGRILQDNQQSSVVGFRYVYESEEVQGGREWGRSLAGVLPGDRGSDLPSRIFTQMFGSTRGTAPPSIWGSIYHNFGLGGVAIAPVVLALIIGKITRKAAIPRQRNTLEVVGIAGVLTTVGLWVVDTPVFLLNTGLVVYMVLWAWGVRASRVNTSETAVGSGGPVSTRVGSTAGGRSIRAPAITQES